MTDTPRTAPSAAIETITDAAGNRIRVSDLHCTCTRAVRGYDVVIDPDLRDVRAICPHCHRTLIEIDLVEIEPADEDDDAAD